MVRKGRGRAGEVGSEVPEMVAPTDRVAVVLPGHVPVEGVTTEVEGGRPVGLL